MSSEAGHIAGRFFKYTLTPGIARRTRALFGSGFQNLSILTAMVFCAVGLLPRNHPYLRQSGAVRFGLYNVIFEARKNLNFKWKNADQIVIFFAILGGMILLALQFAILIVMAFINSSFAGSDITALINNDNLGLGGMFSLPPAYENTDLAYRMLDMVFGPGNFFGSHNEGFVGAYHSSLQSIYAMYSFAILAVGAVILAYFVATIALETATTGTPFGKRFNKVWAPLRLVIGIGLLIPIGAAGAGGWTGFNAGQWVALYAAKFGSNFASNGWVLFNESLVDGYMGDKESLVAIPNTPEMQHIPMFLMMANACIYAEREVNGRDIQLYIVSNENDLGGGSRPFVGTSYEEALAFSHMDDIVIRWGERNELYTDQLGKVYPYCGEMTLETGSIRPEDSGYPMQKGYYDMIYAWATGLGGESCAGVYTDPETGIATQISALRSAMEALLRYYGESYVDYYAPFSGKIQTAPFTGDYSINYAGGTASVSFSTIAIGLPPSRLKREVYEFYQSDITACIEKTATDLRNSNIFDVNMDELRKSGWVLAAKYSSLIAQFGGAFNSSVMAVPRVTKYPDVAEHTFNVRKRQDDNIDPSTRYCPDGRLNAEIAEKSPNDNALSGIYCRIQGYWEEGSLRSDVLASQTRLTNKPFIDAINAVLGTEGLFNMCKNTDIHPLAQLAATGKILIESSIRNLGFSISSNAAGGLAYIFSPHAGAVGMAGGGFFMAVAGVGLLVGFVLFYVIPLMPFIFFFFAVGGWIKGLFEAMVGIPLWALAHIRIDGEGLPGQGAQAGYFLIFEIFLRPIVIIFGFIASILVFTAMIKILNEIFFLVVSNLSGFSSTGISVCGSSTTTAAADVGTIDYFRGPVDEFFFTVVYAVIVYMIAMSCFKLIDTVPNSILRWMNFTMSTFNDTREEPAEGLIQKVTVGGGAIGAKLGSAGDNLGEALGNAGKPVQTKAQESELRGKYG